MVNPIPITLNHPGFLACLLSLAVMPASAQPIPPEESLDLAPEIIENSPLLQDWLEAIPDVRQSIRADPAFAPRFRVGYAEFPATNDQSGWLIGVEDVIVGETPLTVSGHYQSTGDGDRATWGGDLRYYLQPLGSYVNVAPVVGYRHITTEGQQTEGVNLGVKVQFALSRTGAADLSLQQSFVSLGQSEEVGITTLAVGYAVTSQLRLATELEKQNSPWENDSRASVLLEWRL
ncbi:MAG: hypothetical protein F6J87_04350 [Spirulina sp. SIO3F2]|nr:hypothetical protein [Spirulina sp. SIO3F2]